MKDLHSLHQPLSFGRWLKQLRADRDLTQDALAEAVGCAAQTIRTFESGTRRPSRDMAERLADVLEVAQTERDAFLRLARARGAEGLPQTAPVAEPPTLEAAPTPVVAPRAALPTSLNALIGREREHGTIRNALLDPQQRLVTLLGPGGIGKTRLALQLANDLQGQFRDGAHWVALASVARPDDVLTAIADTLGLSLHGTLAPAEQLIGYLQDRETMLVLDNLEHLLDIAPFVGQLLQRSPQVKILVTSRERLRVGGEWVVELGGLALPAEGATNNPHRAEAVLLFVERARQSDHAFALTPANQGVISRICHLLQGLPLGLELAAAWTRTLTVDEIADEIERSLDFLTSTERTASKAHQSLRAVFEHSWQLLASDEQRVLAQLAVFQGGWNRQAAQAIAGATLANLASLQDKSLLHRSADQRYDLHPLVQQYALAKLEANPAAATATHARHCHYYADWVEAQFVPLMGAEQRRIVTHLSVEIDNIRAAWGWAVVQQQLDAVERMAETLVSFFELRDWFREADRLFAQAAQALELPPDIQFLSDPTMVQRQRIVGRLLAYASYLIARLGDFEQAPRRLTHSVVLLEAVDDRWGLVTAYEAQGILAFVQGRYSAAREYCKASLAYAEAMERSWFITGNHVMLGLIAQAEGADEEARTQLKEALALARAMNNPYLIQAALVYYGMALLRVGQEDEARASLQEVLMRADNSWAYNTALHHTGVAALRMKQGDPAEAVQLLEQSLQVFRQQQNHWEMMRILNVLGAAQFALGKFVAARSTYQEALALGIAANIIPTALSALTGLANLAQAEDPAQARQWASYVVRHPASSDDARQGAKELLKLLSGVVTADDATGTEQALAPIEAVVGSLFARTE